MTCFSPVFFQCKVPPLMITRVLNVCHQTMTDAGQDY